MSNIRLAWDVYMVEILSRRYSRKHKMNLCRLIILICLCVVNGFCAGTFLNAVVIISQGKSSQLCRKTCYFMILVLSCFDLAVVMVGHPTIILQSVVRYFNDNMRSQIYRQDSGAHLRDFWWICFWCIDHNEHWSISCHFTSFLLRSLGNQTQPSKIFASYFCSHFFLSCQ